MSRYVLEVSQRLAAVLLPVAAISMLASSPALAQERSNDIFEEIVVLATKRASNILDVPVAVSALTGAQLTEAGIFDMFELQQNVPGLIVGGSQSSTTSNFAIRSIGSTGNNFGVESSVGLYVDGVYRSRQSSMINDLIDIEAVEVLRGPQGTLFGKNTAAGAISVRTVRPGHDRDAFVDVTAGDLGLIRVSAAANIPINDNVALRGTIFSTQRDGYVDDYNLGHDLYNDRDRVGARVQLAINDPDDDFNVRIIADYSEIDELCCVGIVRVDSLVYKGALPGVLNGSIPVTSAVGSQFVNALVGGTVFATYDYPQALLDGLNAQLAMLSPFPGTIVAGASFDDYETALSTPPVSTNEDAGLSVEINKALNNGVQFKSITAYRSFETFDSIDIDFSDADLIYRTNTGEQSSISQEFQFIGEFGQGSSWVAGAYYFGQTLDSTTLTSAGALFNTYVSTLRPSIPALLAGIDQLDAGLEQAGGGLETLLNPATQPFPAGANAFDDVRQDHSGYAVFGQVDYAINDKFTLSLGARYTDETKDIDARYSQTANGPRPDTRPCVPDPMGNPGDYIGGAACVALFEAGAYLQSSGNAGSLAGLIAGDLAGLTQPSVAWGSYLFDPFSPRPDVKDSLSEDQSTGTVKLTFFPTDSTMLYASYATGFKAGGTNTDRINIAFDQLFTAETSKSMELGLKGQYGPVQLVLTYYQTDFDDFQANSFTGTGFNLQNAGDLSIDGVELEVLWRPTQNMEVQAHYTHNEGKYNSFESGTAWDTWVAQIGAWQGQGDPGCTQPFDPANLPTGCPRTGDPLPYNPEDRAFLALTQNFDVGNSNSIVARLEYTYASEQFTDGDLDPFTLQDDISMVNARVGINFGKSNSSLTLWGRNITDERWYHGSADLPVAEDGMFSYPSEPASYGVTYRKSFD